MATPDAGDNSVDTSVDTSALERAFSTGSEATETANDASDENLQDDESKAQDNPEQRDPASPEPQQADWKTKAEAAERQYAELQKLHGRHTQELGELRKELEQLRGSQPKSKPEDPFETDEVLKNLSPEQRKLMDRATAAGVRRVFQQMGLDPQELPRMREALLAMTQQTRQRELAQEVKDLRERVGEEQWAKYRPLIQEWYERNDWKQQPLEQVFKLVSYDDLAAGQAKRIEDNRKSRAERGAAADTGKSSPKSKQSLATDADGLAKMSSKAAWAQILKEEAAAG